MTYEIYLKTVIETIAQVMAQRGEKPLTIEGEDSVRDKVVLDSFEWAEVAIKLEMILGKDPFDLMRTQNKEIFKVSDIAALFSEAE
ncbi:hypothetical protein [Magnetococcus sp. PR-3]|uniref:hypothetical protein n=1 Tax=Magnetococcus sp. PR-3 TaxID=3120355 RepID=UPI002FCDE6DF